MTASTTNIEARREADRRQAALGWVARQLEWERVLAGLRARRDTESSPHFDGRATAVNPGDLVSSRAPYFKSCRNVTMTRF